MNRFPQGYVSIKAAVLLIEEADANARRDSASETSSEIPKPNSRVPTAELLEQALLGNKLKAAAILENDGRMVEFPSRMWRRRFARADDPAPLVEANPYLVGELIRGEPPATREPFAEALQGKTVPAAQARRARDGRVPRCGVGGVVIAFLR